MKQSRAFAVMQKPLAFEFSRVPRDRKMNFLPPGLRKIQPRKIACRPLRTVLKVTPGARIHQRKLHLPWSIRAPDGPVAALCIAAESFRDAQYDAGNHQDKTDRSFQIHGTSLLSTISRETHKMSACFSAINLSKVRF